MASKPRVAVVGTGGTISFGARDSLDLFEYMDFSERQAVEDIIASFPEVSAAADLTTSNHITISSSGVTPDDWLSLNRHLQDLASQSPGFDGIVVTHGTASLEETAYFLNLTCKASIPVVMVGAQRPPSTLGSDAGTNLLNAVRVAAAPESRGLGVLTVLNDEIQGARDVTKTSTLRLQTFKSPDTGPMGYADADGRVMMYKRPFRRHAPDTEFDLTNTESLPRVEIVYSFGGADGAPIEAAVAAGANAIIVAGFAPGLASPPQEEAMNKAAADGVLIVQGSRAGSGRVVWRQSLQSRNMVAADNLNPQKARVLTIVALAALGDGWSAPEVQRMFDTY